MTVLLQQTLFSAFRNNFFLSNIIGPQGFPHACNQPNGLGKQGAQVERGVSSQRKCDREIFTLNQFQICSTIGELVHPQETDCARSR
jgi:hypothetical protein